MVLESTGFQDLLERLTFAQRIQKQDVQIVHQVAWRVSRSRRQAVDLGALEVRQQQITVQVLHERESGREREGARPAADRGRTRPCRESGAAASARETGRQAPEPAPRQAEQAAAARRPRAHGSGEFPVGQRQPERRRGAARLHVPAAQERRVAAGNLVPGPGRRHLGAGRHAGVRRLLGHDRAARDRRLRPVCAGAPLRQLDRRIRLRLLRPRRPNRISCRSVPTSARAR